jgi:hypothetical protein
MNYRDELLEACALAIDKPLDDRNVRRMADALGNATILLVRAELASAMAAALADPDVGDQAKSIAGFLLQRVGGDQG